VLGWILIRRVDNRAFEESVIHGQARHPPLDFLDQSGTIVPSRTLSRAPTSKVTTVTGMRHRCSGNRTTAAHPRQCALHRHRSFSLGRRGSRLLQQLHHVPYRGD
jgi:hypothetical protein